VPNVPNARQVHGGALGYNNYLDAEAALASALEFKGGGPAVSIIKHSNPCGLATGKTTREAMERAWEGDPVSAFGSVIALTHDLDIGTAKFIEDRFVEVIVAPAIEPDALEYIRGLGGKKKNLRLLEYGNTGAGGANPPRLRAITGGLLEQESDDLYYLCDTADGLLEPGRELSCPNSGKKLVVGTVTKQKFNSGRGGLIGFALRHCKHVKSNAIVIAREYADGRYQALGMGCGQPNRKDSVMLCAMRAVDNLRNEFLAKDAPAAKSRDAHLAALDDAAREKYLAGEDAYVAGQLQSDAVVLASDAFFPFRDGLDNAATTRVKHIVQPGGSVRDDEVIAAADEQGIAMIFTGVRKFNH
jgi:phosphoribosylaminoimidazolecarboxamide formyltransferase/IMP cyclohydrolase